MPGRARRLRLGGSYTAGCASVSVVQGRWASSPAKGGDPGGLDWFPLLDSRFHAKAPRGSRRAAETAEPTSTAGNDPIHLRLRYAAGGKRASNARGPGLECDARG